MSDKLTPLPAKDAKPLAGALEQRLKAAGEALPGAFEKPKVAEAKPEALEALPYPLDTISVTLSGDPKGALFLLGKPEGPLPKVAAALGEAGPSASAQDAKALAPGGWLVEAPYAAGEAKGSLWMLVPAELGAALAEAHRKARADAAKGAGATVAATGTKGRILVVDDQHSIRTLIKRHLEKEGYEPVLVANAEEALQSVKKALPKAVLMDVMMPGMDGFEACRRLRQIPGAGAIPVILCTGKGQRQDVVEALQAGANDYIVKPFTREILLTKLAKALLPKPGG